MLCFAGKIGFNTFQMRLYRSFFIEMQQNTPEYT